jgi:kynureninase
MNSRSSLLRRHRPAGPSCRGGASSVLRLAQPVVPSLSGWLGRAAEFAMPLRELHSSAQNEFASSIITRLLPSHELARR